MKINTHPQVPQYILFNEKYNDDNKKEEFLRDMKLYENYITSQEEKSLFDEIETCLKGIRYENYHWDDAIENYRETEKLHWNSSNKAIIDRVKNLAFPSGTLPLKYVHVLDLKADGVIKPHIDSIKFCGDTIAGISLLTDSVMRLRLDKVRERFVDVLLKRYSLYIMRGSARYDYTHEILSNAESRFGSECVIKTRRISVICRNEP